MHPHCSLLLFAAAHWFRLTIGDTPGICSTSHTVTRKRFVLDKTDGLQPRWVIQEYQIPVSGEGCCANYTMKSESPLVCEPVCNPPCEKAQCMAPDTCVCFPGHDLVNNSTTTCFDVCDSCVNGQCMSNDEECTCYPGYERDEIMTHICDPICNPPCENGHCKAPNKCECYEGFERSGGVCAPRCSVGCAFGKCTAPEVCTCFEGYMNDQFSPGDCLPVCNQTCENGYCSTPGSCACFRGFELHPRNPFQCVPRAPENYSLNICELKMHKAIKFDRDVNCFVVKDKVTISSTSDCQPLDVLSQPVCLHPGACGFNKCVLDFRCSMKKVNGSNEMYCNLETDDFETEESEMSIVNGTEWSDVVLVVDHLRNINVSNVDVKLNQRREWTLRTLSKKPVCAQMHFGVEICPMSGSAAVTNGSHLNSTIMIVLNVLLILGVILLVGFGVGGFLWARHRRLNNPLNYREDMVNGYYNRSFDNTPCDLVADDEQDSDDPL